MDWKKLIIKCLIFLPTLNYCISLSMNENSLCYENPPPLKKVPETKRFEKNRSKFFQTWVSLHFHLEMNTDSLGTWNKILEKLSICCPPFFLIFWEKKKTFAANETELYQKICCTIFFEVVLSQISPPLVFCKIDE